jgi:hypothetical protein
MRRLTCAALLLTVFAATIASATEQTIRDVATGSAVFSGKHRREIIVRADVDLPNSCWSNPRFEKPARGQVPDADGVVPLTVVADVSEAPGTACAMIFRRVPVPALRWRAYPINGLKAVKLIGARRFLTVPIETPDAAHN